MKDTNGQHINKSGFKVPENYFEEFRASLKLEADQQTSKKKFKLRPMHYSIAASVVLVIVSVFTFMPPKQSTNTNIEHGDILLSDLEYYDIDMHDLYYAYNDELIESSSQEPEISDDVLIDYIADEIEIEDMILYEE
jgi:hypothetical protein